jgi:multidrug efflux pump subunit AcrA (membrane-fusion protein)
MSQNDNINPNPIVVSVNKPAETVSNPMDALNKPHTPPPTYTPKSLEVSLPRSSLVIWTIALALGVFFAWAYVFELEEVSTGTGKVVAASKEQDIQTLEGGVLSKLMVKEGDIVQAGQVLAQFDRTRGESAVGESGSRARAAQASAARLRAEVNQTALVFPPEVKQFPDLVRSETELFNSRRHSLQESLSGFEQSSKLIKNELAMTEPLVAKGAASDVEVLRLKRDLNDIQSKAMDTRTQYIVKAREELAKTNEELQAQQSVTRGRDDSLSRLTFTSPVRGVVKDIALTTVGGVLAPNGRLMEIVPLDDQLEVEARISPRDIAYIRVGQPATVKITAYDYSIYGGLPGKVVLVSPDTIQDEVHRENYYYRVNIRTDSNNLKNKAGKSMAIVPGMIASVDIHTGSKTILWYLLKPLNKAKEALRER